MIPHKIQPNGGLISASKASSGNSWNDENAMLSVRGRDRTNLHYSECSNCLPRSDWMTLTPAEAGRLKAHATAGCEASRRRPPEFRENAQHLWVFAGMDPRTFRAFQKIRFIQNNRCAFLKNEHINSKHANTIGKNGRAGYTGITTFQPHNDWHVHRRRQHLAPKWNQNSTQRCENDKMLKYVGSTPHPVTVTTRTITFLVENPYITFICWVGGTSKKYVNICWVSFLFHPQVKPPSLPNATGSWGAWQSWYRCGESRLPHNLEPSKNLATITGTTGNSKATANSCRTSIS